MIYKNFLREFNYKIHCYTSNIHQLNKIDANLENLTVDCPHINDHFNIDYATKILFPEERAAQFLYFNLVVKKII